MHLCLRQKVALRESRKIDIFYINSVNFEATEMVDPILESS